MNDFGLLLNMLQNQSLPLELREKIVTTFEYMAKAYIFGLKCVDPSDPLAKCIRKAFKNIVDDLLSGEE